MQQLPCRRDATLLCDHLDEAGGHVARLISRVLVDADHALVELTLDRFTASVQWGHPPHRTDALQ